MNIKVKYLRDIPHLERIKQGDWIDLRAGIDADLKPGEYMIIPRHYEREEEQHGKNT